MGGEKGKKLVLVLEFEVVGCGGAGLPRCARNDVVGLGRVSYDQVDTAIAEWTTRHGLVLTRSFGGRAVRNVYISSVTADVFQIWVDEPENGYVAIHAAGVEGVREDDPQRDWVVSVENLASALDEVLRVVEQWMHPSHPHVPAGAGV